MEEELGRLIKVPLRKFWENEEDDFTPWLAREENISLLSEIIRMELEVEGTEIKVGPFEADILCRDTVTDKQVVIENQLEPTDHKHLGQLLTYAPGLDAVTAIWIAERFKDEHRAALNWFNEITPEEFSFFGLEIELWRIGNSPIAPNFNVVSHPNAWTKTASRISPGGELTSTKQLYLEYWTGMRDLLEERNGVIKPRKPLPQNTMRFGIGRSKFRLDASASIRDKWISVGLTLWGPDAKPHFHLLERDKVDIGEEIGVELDWDEKYDWKRSQISFSLHETDLEDREDWNRQYQWLCEQLEIFHKAFSPRVKVLDVGDDVPEEDETDE